MTHKELMNCFNRIEETVGLQLITLQEDDGQFKLVSIKDVLSEIKSNFCKVCSEDIDNGIFFAEDDSRNGQPLHYCPICGAYLGEASY